MKQLFVTALTILLLASCEKNISFNLNNADPVLVVDAQIESGRVPSVILTHSLDYFSTLSPQALAASFVHGATVVMGNGQKSNRFKEYAVPLGGGITAYYYGLDTSNAANLFTGEFNTYYQLDISSDGISYSATTSIPKLTKFPDSLWFKKAPFNPDTSARILMTHTTDPPGLGNYIRYFTRKNGENFLPRLNSVYDDGIIDGTSYVFQVEPGVDRNNPVSNDKNYFRVGDTVSLKVCNIDKATYTFWNTWEFAQQANGNPFSQPNKVIGNISNGALGAFYGYAAAFKSIVIPK